MTTSNPVLLYDGVCALCNAFVRFVLRHDRKQRIYFAPLQSDVGRLLLNDHALDPDALSTVVLIDRGRAYTRSDAALRVLRLLGGFWRVPALLRVLPKAFRNGVYGVVARYRYRWFGRFDACPVPSASIRHRFLDHPGTGDRLT